MLNKTLIAASALAAIATAATSQTVNDISVGLGSTSFGRALEGAYTISPQVGVRGLLMGGPTLDYESEDATVDGEAKFGGFAAVGDYYPFANAWRISGGIFISNTEITVGVNDEGLEYGGKIEFVRPVAPMVTTGFSAEVAPGWSFSGDIGVIFSSLEVSSDEDDPVVQDDIDELNSDLEDVPVFPFVAIGVSYAF